MSDKKINIPYSDLDFESILQQGEKRMAEEAAAAEVAKRGNLRGGNSGCIAENGDIYGCHRSAIARALGYQEAIDTQTQLFFDAGNGIEEILRPKVEAGWDEGVRCEEEIPVRWKTDAGHQVTGRPDFVLMYDNTDKTKLGVELKTIASYNGMKRTYIDHKPDAKHVIQSAHYMWQHDCPWVLTYVSPTRFMASLYDFKKLPREAKMKIDPFRAHFYLTYRDGKVFYRFAGKEVETIITAQGINDYYDLIKECMEKEQLFYHPASKYITGEQMPYQHENYCGPCKAATEANGDWDTWVSLLKERSK